MRAGSVGVVPRPAAGSVHASRNPPRAPAASLRDRLRRALTEVDPIWLAQSNDPAAVAFAAGPPGREASGRVAGAPPGDLRQPGARAGGHHAAAAGAGVGDA